jgi:hypothetical protein
MRSRADNPILAALRTLVDERLVRRSAAMFPQDESETGQQRDKIRKSKVTRRRNGTVPVHQGLMPGDE